MSRLPASVQALGTDAFDRVLQAEIQALPLDALPLRGATEGGGWVDRDGFEVALQRVEEAQGVIRAVLGIFFTEVLMACNCSDEPPRQRVYCRVELVLDVATAEARFSLLSE